MVPSLRDVPPKLDPTGIAGSAMSLVRLILASLAYHWRIHAAVACGVAVAAAVLTGALLVGDSMRGSLRGLTLDRLGRIDQAVVAESLFRAELAEEWSREPALASRNIAVAPAILLRVSLENVSRDPSQRANQVNLIGCDRRFWALGDAAPPPLDAREIALNASVAESLGASVGDHLIIRLPRLGAIPAENPLGRRTDTVDSYRVQVAAIVPDAGLGRFSLRASQRTAANAFVPLDWLQDRLQRPGGANALFVAAPTPEPLAAAVETEVAEALRPKLADYGIHAAKTKRDYLNLTTDRMVFDAGAERAVLHALEAQHTTPLQPVITYLANSIALGNRAIPYSTIAGVDFVEQPPLGPMLAADGKPLAPLAGGEIALNSWAADDLGAKIGDTIRIAYFEPESTHGEVREREATFRLAAIVQLVGAAADPGFTPEVPGVTDQLSISNWDPPFPFDARRVRKKDDQYWQQHRGTPKAFVSLATGRRLWGSRFGQTTSLRVGPGVSVEQLEEQLATEPAAMGLVVQPVKRQGLAASQGTTPFEALFLGFSFFIIASAVMLVALLFRLGVDRRASEMGILMSVGLRRRTILGLLSGEGLLVTAAGSLLGMLGGIGYAALMILGLTTLWLAAVVTPFLRLHVTTASLAIGWASSMAVALLAIVWSAWRMGRNPPRQLLSGRTSAEGLAPGPRRRWVEGLAAALLVVAVAVGVFGMRLSQDAQAGAFFGAGAAVLVASLILVRTRLAAGRTGSAVAVGRGNLARLALRNAARNPLRSTLTIGLVAAATFLIVSVSAFRVDPRQQTPRLDSGNGGFALIAESDQPIYQDPNTAEGRAALGISPDDAQTLAQARIFAFRVRPGDDASCLNLYRPEQPRVLGVPPAMIERGGFAWSAAKTGSGDGSNPWQLLSTDLGQDPDGVPRVPVAMDNNTAMYSLHLYGGVGEVFEIRDDRGRVLRLEVVGLLANSVLQGELLISEGAFRRYFPDQTGYRLFLVECPPEQTAAVRTALERGLGDFGLSAETTGDRLAAFLAVQNTYLSTFQSLGGLGLLLGTFGLAAVQLRSVLERRSELALLRAVGFRRRDLATMVLVENGLLLMAGLACGIVASLVAVLPHFVAGGASIPWAWLAATLGLVLFTGLAAGMIAVRAAVATPLLESLRAQ
jgi:ABC-type lipoprotein release transport system permease subunit